MESQPPDNQPRYITRDRIQTVFTASMPDLVMAQARTDGFVVGHEIRYICDATADSFFFEDAITEWKQTFEWGRAEAVFRFTAGVVHLRLLGNILTANAYGREDSAVEAIIDSLLTGKLVLWHGEPGTGKTYALRAWAKTCRDTLNVNYIADPEMFFSTNANYMFDLLGMANKEKLNLFVAEDTGELLARDAKRNEGQALSRLLNLCDGLIGQGLRSLFLITTNEDLGALHPAVRRPGRCYANIEFEPFGQAEAREWLRSHGVDDAAVPSRSSLADLYSIVEANQIVAQKQKVFGFVA